MKLIIAGSRTWFPSVELIHEHVCNIDARVTEIVCGEARGADTAGKCYAIAKHLKLKSFPADWEKYGKGAGHSRNRDMADYGDAALVFWDNQSSGSANMVANMVARQKPVWVVTR